MEVREILLLVVVAFVAVTALVRLMLARHNRLLDEARAQIEAESRRKAAEEAGRAAGPPRRAAS